MLELQKFSGSVIKKKKKLIDSLNIKLIPDPSSLKNESPNSHLTKLFAIPILCHPWNALSLSAILH